MEKKVLKIQQFLREFGLAKAIQEFKLKTRIYDRKVLLKYDQLESDMSIEEVQECRGLILERDTWNILSFAFEKFFNAGESNAAVIDWDSALVLDKVDGTLIQFATGQLQIDPELIKIAVNQNINVFDYYSDCDCVKRYSILYDKYQEYKQLVISEIIRTHNYRRKNPIYDLEIATAAIIIDENLFGVCHKSLKASKPFVLEILSECGWMLYMVDKTLQTDPDVVMTALKSIVSVTSHILRNLLFDVAFIDKSLHNNKEIMRIIIGIDNSYLHEIKYTPDKSLVLAAISDPYKMQTARQPGNMLRYTSSKFYLDPELVSIALKKGLTTLCGTP